MGRIPQVVDDQKRCSNCGEFKQFSAFFKNRSNTSGNGLSSWCKSCEKSRRRDKKAYDLGRRYGITEEQYLELTVNGCQVCGRKERLCVDHDHATGNVRGCLCSDCNSALGFLKDSQDLVNKLSSYMGGRLS